MRLLIIYDQDECETLDDATTVANLVQLTFDRDGWEIGIDTVHIGILSENVLSLATGGGIT